MLNKKNPQDRQKSHQSFHYNIVVHLVPHVFFEEVSVPPALFLIVQQVHTHPTITTTSTMKNKPASSPRAIVGFCDDACCVHVVDLQSFS